MAALDASYLFRISLASICPLQSRLSDGRLSASVLSEEVSAPTDGLYGLAEGVSELNEEVFALLVAHAFMLRAEGVQQHLIFASETLLLPLPPQAESGVGVTPHFEEWPTWPLGSVQCFGSAGPLSSGVQQVKGGVDEGIQLAEAEAHAQARG